MDVILTEKFAPEGDRLGRVANAPYSSGSGARRQDGLGSIPKPVSVRMRLFGDADADGKQDDAIDEFSDGCDGAPNHFCFNPDNHTVTFLVPYSGILGRLEFRYHDTPIGTSRTVVYFRLP